MFRWQFIIGVMCRYGIPDITRLGGNWAVSWSGQEGALVVLEICRWFSSSLGLSARNWWMWWRGWKWWWWSIRLLGGHSSLYVRIGQLGWGIGKLKFVSQLSFSCTIRLGLDTSLCGVVELWLMKGKTFHKRQHFWTQTILLILNQRANSPSFQTWIPNEHIFELCLLTLVYD